MSSKDQSTQQNSISEEEEALFEVMEKGNRDTITIDVKQSASLNEQDPPAELSDNELALVAGSADLASIAKITNREFVRSGVAGITGLASGIASFSAVNAINKGKIPKTNA